VPAPASSSINVTIVRHSMFRTRSGAGFVVLGPARCPSHSHVSPRYDCPAPEARCDAPHYRVAQTERHTARRRLRRASRSDRTDSGRVQSWGRSIWRCSRSFRGVHNCDRLTHGFESAEYLIRASRGNANCPRQRQLPEAQHFRVFATRLKSNPE
jgi:hypothetical protein